MKQNQEMQKPFFARFLESQQSHREGTSINSIPWPLPWPITDKLRDHLDETQKYPSDGDEDVYI